MSGRKEKRNMKASRQGLVGSAGLVLICAILLIVAPEAQAFTSICTTHDFPEASNTWITGVNNAGVMVGLYTDSGGVAHGFTLEDAGLPTEAWNTFDCPGATWTEVYDINDSGHMVGEYELAGEIHAFFYDGEVCETVFFDGDGPFTTTTDTSAEGINNSDHYVGEYELNSDGVMRGYRYDGTYQPVDHPGPLQNSAEGINDSGWIVGDYENEEETEEHGYLVKDHGLPTETWTTFDFPGASTTGFEGINNLGNIVGGYTDGIGGEYGFFLKSPDSPTVTWIKTDCPGSILTGLEGINDLNLAVGSYEVAGGVAHGFATVPEPADTDGDGVRDDADNCITAPNFGQKDSDNDLCGNHCDADYNQDSVVSILDFATFRACVNGAEQGVCDHAPEILDGVISIQDFGVFRQQFLAGVPGPGQSAACDGQL
jgi:hypothetical protein